MKLDVLLLTRTSRKDYDWVYKPKYVDSSVNSLLRPLFIAVEAQANRDLFETNGKKNLFFYLERNYCIFVHLYFTERMDQVGRRIYALEGLACRKSDGKKFWKLIPLLIEEMYGSTLNQRYYYFQEENFEYGKQELQIELPEAERSLRANYEELEKRYREYNDSFLNILEETTYTNQMFSFVYGNCADNLSFENLERRFQIGEKRKIYVPEKECVCELADEEECRLYFGFRKNAGSYKISAYAVCNEDRVVIGIQDVFTANKRKIQVKSLSLLCQLMEKQMEIYGYEFAARLSDEMPVKRKYPAISENVWEEKWNCEIIKVQYPMNLSDGRASSYEYPEEQCIRQLFQYACRIEDAYFGDNCGRDTVYVLNQKSGLWIFLFIRENGSFRMEGIVITKYYAEQAWIFLEEILKKYIRKPGILLGAVFEERYSCFLSDVKEKLHPESYIVSAIPKEYFPSMKNVTTCTNPSMKELFSPVMNIEDRAVPFNEDKKRDEILLIPPTIGKKWNLNRKYERKYYGAAERKILCRAIIETTGKEKKIFKRDEDFYCDAAAFFREVKMSL